MNAPSEPGTPSPIRHTEHTTRSPGSIGVTYVFPKQWHTWRLANFYRGVRISVMIIHRNTRLRMVLSLGGELLPHVHGSTLCRAPDF
jgi:hypothetical protein